MVIGSQAYRCDSCQIQVAVRCERRVVIVVEYRLVYQLISKSQAAKSCSGGSTVPAAVVIVVKYSELDLLISY